MSKNTNESSPLISVEESVLEYIERNQEQFHYLLGRALELGQIDEVTYRRFLIETCEGRTWDEVTDHFHSVNVQLSDTCYENERNKLLQRLLDGAKKIDEAQDEGERRYLHRVYAAIENKLDELERGRKRE